MVGRRQTAGGSTYMPLRVNMERRHPVIFAAALPGAPADDRFVPAERPDVHQSYFSPTSWAYLGVEAALIIIFTYFLHCCPVQPGRPRDNNLRKNGGYIPGIRPGPPTGSTSTGADALTLPGSLFLAVVPCCRRSRSGVRLLAGDRPCARAPRS